MLLKRYSDVQAYYSLENMQGDISNALLCGQPQTQGKGESMKSVWSHPLSELNYSFLQADSFDMFAKMVKQWI